MTDQTVESSAVPQTTRVGRVVITVLVGLALVAIIVAWLAAPETLLSDPCASGWDNLWVQRSAVLIVLAAAVSATFALAALLTRRFKAAALGLLRTVVVLVGLSAAWIVLAIGAYGWHCLR